MGDFSACADELYLRKYPLCKELIPAVLERTKRLGVLNDGNSAKHGDCCAYERISIHDEAAAVHE